MTEGISNKLQRRMTADALGHLLETRPDWDDLAAEGLGEFLTEDDYYFYLYATTLTTDFYICYFWLF